MPSMSQHEKQT